MHIINKITIKIISLILSLAVIFPYSSKGQENTNDPLRLPDVIGKSPEATSLGRFGDIPVNEFTGTPDISIPLHTISIGGLEVPITLNYHASGIQVNQESTFVGLGWNIFPGGSISYIPVGEDERLIWGNVSYSTFFNWSQWQTVFDLDKGYLFGENGPFNYSQTYSTGFFLKYAEKASAPELGTAIVDNVLASWCANTHEGEQDIYSVNILGRSFKFIRHPSTGEIIFLGQKTKDRIQYSYSNFIIIDANGIKYYFNDKEMVGTNSNMINCWYLSLIQDAKGNYIQFNYQNFGSIYSIPPLSEIYVEADQDIGRGLNRNLSVNNRSINNLYLTGIETNLEKVDFQFIEGRRDLTGPGKRHLDKVIVKDKLNNKNVKVYKFDYSYFIGNTTGGNYLNDHIFIGNVDPMPDDVSLSYRLKLIGMKQLNPDDTTIYGPEYHFTYDETFPLPWKTSFSKDFWGFYNGQENNIDLEFETKHTLIPDPKLYSEIIPQGYETFKGANRSMSKSFSVLGILKSITYPTGGKTEFEFEPHISNSKYGGTAEGKNALFSTFNLLVSDYNDNLVPSISHPAEVFTITDTTEIIIKPYLNAYDYNYLDISNTYITLTKVNNPGQQIVRYDIFSDTSLWIKDFVLQPGTYVLLCHLDDNIPFPGVVNMKPIVYASLTYTVKNSLPPELLINYSGGLRIKSLTNYDEKNNLTSIKSYLYDNGSELKPSMFYYHTQYGFTKVVETGYDAYGNKNPPLYLYSLGNKYTYSSDNMVQMSGYDVGSSVGYSKVEIQNRSNNGANNGKEIAFYNLYQPTLMGDRYFYVQPGLIAAGDLTKRVYLNQTNDTVRKEQFEYNEISVSKRFLNAEFCNNYYGDDTHKMGDFTQYSILVYLNKSFFHFLQKKSTFDYLGGKLSGFTEYSYDTINYCLDEVIELTSNGKLKNTKYSYPHDFSTSVYPSMVSLNQINPVIEQTNLLDGTQVDYLKTDYNLVTSPSNPVYLPGKIYTKYKNGLLEERISYDFYGEGGNIIQYHKTNNINTYYYWGYNNQYPVAKIENLAYSEIDQNLKTLLDRLDDINLTNSELQSLNNSIRNYSSLNNKMVTTFTYKPLVGIKTQTDPNGKTTYYEYDSFGRLVRIRDNDQNIIKEIDYKYKNQ
ncbi:MAG: RHS repeat domain-containing protein [Bacteroidales bacterium]